MQMFSNYLTKVGKNVVIGSKRHLDLEEGGAKCRPLVDDFEEAEFGVFSSLSRVLVEQRHDGLKGRQTENQLTSQL